MLNKARLSVPALPALAVAMLALVAFVASVSLADQPASTARADSSHSAADAPSAPPIPAVEAAADKLLARAKRFGGVAAVHVVDLSTGAVVANRRGELAHNPASNMKILTAWAALRTMGPQHRYRTGLYGRIKAGSVARLAISGDGDPRLDRRHLMEMVDRLRRAGVKKIADIVVDQSAFDHTFIPPAFAQQPNEWATFRAPVSAVSLNQNTVMIEVRPNVDGGPATVSVVPKSFVTVVGRVMTVAAGKAEAVQLALSPQEDRLRAKVGGVIPEDSPTVRVYRRVDDPRLLAGYALADICRSMGIVVTGTVLTGPRRGKLLSGHRSDPLSMLLQPLGKASNNFFAETIFKGLSVVKSGEPASFSRSTLVLERLLDEQHLDRAGLSVTNGSGLFDANLVSPKLLVGVLRDAWRDPVIRPEFMSQLSRAGVDGTLRRRLRALPAGVSIRAKTGTLNAVGALAGIAASSVTGRAYAFALVANDVAGKGAAVRVDLDRVARAVAEAAATN